MSLPEEAEGGGGSLVKPEIALGDFPCRGSSGCSDCPLSDLLAIIFVVF